MQIIGVVNPDGFNFLKDNIFIGPLNLNVVYQDDDGKYYIKYLDSGDLILLLSRLDGLKTKINMKRELDRFLGERESFLGYPRKYGPIKNEYFFTEVLLDGERTGDNGYIDLVNYPQDKIFIEPDYKTTLDSFNQAVVMPNHDLYIGQYRYIYENIVQKLTIEGKSGAEIMSIIRFLINDMYLDEAYDFIMQIKANVDKFDESSGRLVNFDNLPDFLNQSLKDIDKINYVKKRTKSINYKIFDRK